MVKSGAKMICELWDKRHAYKIETGLDWGTLRLDLIIETLPILRTQRFFICRVSVVFKHLGEGASPSR